MGDLSGFGGEQVVSFRSDRQRLRIAPALVKLKNPPPHLVKALVPQGHLNLPLGFRLILVLSFLHRSSSEPRFFRAVRCLRQVFLPKIPMICAS